MQICLMSGPPGCVCMVAEACWWGRDPQTLGIGTTQFGAEFASPWTLMGGKIPSGVHANFQAKERRNWAVTRSLMAGLQFENARISRRAPA